MKNFTLTTIIALLVTPAAFSQTQRETGTNVSVSRTITTANNNNGVSLLSPADGKQIITTDGSKPVLFRWTAIVPKPKEAVTYRLKVWQLMQGQNGTEAMRSNQPIVTKDVVNITQAAISNLYTGPCKPPYLCDFIWAVEVLNSEGISIGNSYAANSSFKVEVENIAAENTKYGNPSNPGSYGMSSGKSTDNELKNVEAVKAEGGNKGNAGNTGMAGGKSLNTSGESIDKEIDKNQRNTKKVDKELDKNQPNAKCLHTCIHCDHQLKKLCNTHTKILDKELDKNQPTKSIETQDGTVQGVDVKPVTVLERRRPVSDASWELYKVKFPCNCFWCQ